MNLLQKCSVYCSFVNDVYTRITRLEITELDVLASARLWFTFCNPLISCVYISLKCTTLCLFFIPLSSCFRLEHQSQQKKCYFKRRSLWYEKRTVVFIKFHQQIHELIRLIKYSSLNKSSIPLWLRLCWMRLAENVLYYLAEF